MPQADYLGSATPGLEGAPRSRSHERRITAAQATPVLVPKAENTEEERAHEASAFGSTE